MTVDEIHEILDGDKDVQASLSKLNNWINRCRTYDVISFSNYRNLRCSLQGWKPVSLEEYRLKLKGDRVALKRYQENTKRIAHNNRIQDAIEASNPFNTIA